MVTVFDIPSILYLGFAGMGVLLLLLVILVNSHMSDSRKSRSASTSLSSLEFVKSPDLRPIVDAIMADRLISATDDVSKLDGLLKHFDLLAMMSKEEHADKRVIKRIYGPLIAKMSHNEQILDIVSSRDEEFQWLRKLYAYVVPDWNDFYKKWQSKS